MLYEPVALLAVSVDIPVATFLAEILAFGIAPPCASVMVPDSVAPVTCARSGTEMTTPMQRIDTNNMHLTVLELIEAHPFCYYFQSLFPYPETPLPLEKQGAVLPACRRALRATPLVVREISYPRSAKGSRETHPTRPCVSAEYSQAKRKLAERIQLRI